MRVKVALFVIVISLSCYATVGGQALSNIPGAFSEAGFGVRPAGMGQAFTAVSNDANAFLTNPAGLLLGSRSTFAANYTELFGVIPSGYFGLLQPINKRNAIGGGFLFTGDEALMENTLGLSYAFTFSNLPVGDNEIYFDQMAFGITFKGRWTSFGNNADGGENRVTGSGKGYCIDLGYILLIDENLSLGILVRDLLNKFEWDSSVSGKYTENIPATLKIGGAYHFNGLIVTFDLRKSLHEDTANRAYFGIEKRLFDVLVLRTGFSNNIGTTDLNRRWSFGLTVIQTIMANYKIGINTAYGVGNIENLFRFGLDLEWGEPKKIPPKGRVY